MLQADDGRAQQLDAVLPQLARPVRGCRCHATSHTKISAIPGPARSRHAELHQFFHAVLANRIRRREHVQRPALAALLHALQQLHGALAVQQEVLVHHEERAHVHRLFHLLHDIEQLIARLIEVDALAFAAEERRRGAEVAAHRTADGRNDGRCRVARAVGNAHAQHTHAEAREDFRMADGRVRVFAQITAHPGDALAANHAIGINQFVDAGDGGDVPADQDLRFGRQPANSAAHFAHLAEVRDDAGDADDVVFVRCEFLFEALERGEVEQRAGRRDVTLNHHQTPGAVKHAQRETALRARDLVVIQLHRIDGAAAELVVARIGPEDRTQQNAGLGTFGM